VGGVFKALNDGVHVFGSGAGDPGHEIVENASGMVVDQIHRFDRQGKLRGPHSLHPVPKELENSFIGKP